MIFFDIHDDPIKMPPIYSLTWLLKVLLNRDAITLIISGLWRRFNA